MPQFADVSQVVSLFRDEERLRLNVQEACVLGYACGAYNMDRNAVFNFLNSLHKQQITLKTKILTELIQGDDTSPKVHL